MSPQKRCKGNYLVILPILFLNACSDGSDNVSPSPVEYDFTAVDAVMQEFIDGNDEFDGYSYILVDRDSGSVHEAAVGDQSVEDVLMIASASKVPAATQYVFNTY